MKRVVSTLDKIEKDLSALEEERKRYNDGAAERLLSSLGKALGRLEELPAAEEGASEQRARAEGFEERIRTLVAEKGSLGARSGLDAKAAGRLNAANTKLQNLANELAKQGERGTFNERQRERMASKVAGLADELGAFPVDNPVVAGLLERQAALEASLASLGEGLDAAQAEAAETAAEQERLESDPAFAGDVERVKGFCELFKSGRRYFSLDAVHLRKSEGIEEEAREQARRRAQNAADYQELRQRYDPIVSDGRSRSEIKWALLEGDKWLVSYGELLEGFQREAPAAVASAVDEVGELARAALAGRDHHPFSYESSKLRARAAYARNVAELYDLCQAGEALTPRVEALEAELAAAAEELAEDIVSAKRAPENAYTGGDQSELEAFARAQWAEHFPDEEVLGLRFPQEAFARTTAWRAKGNQMTKVDHSDLWIRVLVASGQEAILYRVLLTRDHLQSERLTLRWSRPTPVPPSERMLRENL